MSKVKAHYSDEMRSTFPLININNINNSNNSEMLIECAPHCYNYEISKKFFGPLS